MEKWQRDLWQFRDDFYNANLMPAYVVVDNIVSRGFAANFAAKVDELGMAWPPHAPMTIAMYGVHDLLILSGAMYAAAVGGSGHKFDVKGDEVVIGVDGAVIPYAIVHHVGGGRVPRRRVVYVNDNTLHLARAAFEVQAKRLIKQR